MALSRRNTLQILPGLLIGGFTGCTALQSSRPIRIVAYTNSPEEHTIQISIQKDTETLVNQQLVLPRESEYEDPVNTKITDLPVYEDDQLDVAGTIIGTGAKDKISWALDCRGDSVSDLLVARIHDSDTLILSDSCYDPEVVDF